ncbi:site-specific DNA-methyltransferase [Pseudomonas brenneri]|uniref:DNA-methyltransferase n=1 Tax=Pseudomonas fluorescens group TaxID=136843 RepID=UPI0014767FA6|nr:MULTISPECIES: site-specific DNA-methyltransferase [Pseudomonas fluorescens group]NNA90446.1 site-specific DNA-methyltransferase [Pseudomonas gessardii]WJM90609.1 site-specific DNA-methyltransferase [Pseudomonas brenneri]
MNKPIVEKVTRAAQLSLDASTIFEGDAVTVLRRLPSNSVRCVVTSPPYWGLRDYGIDDQIGLELTMPQFIQKLVAVFAEVRRVLTDDGTLWINIGDGYTSGNRGYRATDKKNPARAMTVRPDTPEGLKPKDLMGIPWRLAFALQDDGWYLRTDIIWNKPNAMPESVKDRPTRSHEFIFMFSKSEKYFYNSDAVKQVADGGGLRNLRTVWNVNTKPYAGAHFATFPPELVRPCVKASTEPGDFVLDPFFGAGTVGLVCNEEDRKYAGVELNPSYVNLAVERLGGIFHNVVRISAA